MFLQSSFYLADDSTLQTMTPHTHSHAHFRCRNEPVRARFVRVHTEIPLSLFRSVLLLSILFHTRSLASYHSAQPFEVCVCVCMCARFFGHFKLPTKVLLKMLSLAILLYGAHALLCASQYY